jgi:DNA-binding NarL/FixJ family response regulator
VSVVVNGSEAMRESAVAKRPTRVLIAAASSTAAARLHRLLERENAVQVLGTIHRIAELASAIADHDPDVVLWHAFAEHGELSDDVLAAGLPLVVIVDHSEPNWIRQLLAGRIRGLLLGNPGKRELIGAIESAAAGLIAISSSLTPYLRPAAAIAGEEHHPEHLTAREQEVLEMMMEGLSNKEIAMCLNVSTHTVKFHISSVLGKLGASSRTEAITIGVRRGLITI